MNIAPINEPNTMIPAHAATQNTRRLAMCRSYRGFAARRWRMTNAISAATAMISEPDRQRPLVRDRQEIDREDERPDEDKGQDATQVVDGLARSR